MKILVFGSNGLVGSNIKKVFSLDNSFDCFFSNRSDTDLFNFDKTLDTIIDFEPEVIINSAARVGGIMANNTQRTSFLIENLKINLNILESLKFIKPIKMINLGSSCIYPLNATNPIREESIMTGTLEPTNSAYAMAKLTSIELGLAIKKEYGHKVINLMPTNLYGTNDNFSPDESHVIPGLIRRLHSAKQNNQTIFKVWGTGKPLREFLNAEDLASAIKFIILNEIDDDLINIGSGDEISINALAVMLKNVIKFNGVLEFDVSKPDGNPRKFLDSSKIFNYGWEPKILLEDGLIETYEWFLKNY